MDIIVPKVGLTVQEVEIGEWYKAAGDRIEVGAVILEVHADKVDIEVEAEVAGVLTELRVATGDVVEVGDVLGVIVTE